MSLLVFYFLLAVIVSFLCSIVEAAFLSTPLSHLKVQQKEGRQTATLFLKHKKNVDRPLAAILTLNTAAHTVGAAGVGMQSNIVFGEIYFGVVSAAMTVIILVFTEIIPKTIGAQYWRNLTGFTAVLISGMIFVSYPLVVLMSRLSRRFTSEKQEKTISREEISELAHIGKDEGTFGEKENSIIQNLMRLKQIRVEEIMTPRVVVSIANENCTFKEFAEKTGEKKFSRIPLYSGHREHITGYVFRQNIFERIAGDDELSPLSSVKRPILVVPESSTVLGVWEQLLAKKEHIAQVVDEYGGLAGIVTMEDIIETLLGFEIVDEKDTVPDMQEYARQLSARRRKEI